MTASPLRLSRSSFSVTPLPPPLTSQTQISAAPSAPLSSKHKITGVTSSLNKISFVSISSALQHDQELLWLDLCSPMSSDVTAIASKFNLHAVTAKDCLFGSFRDKCDVYPHYTMIGINVGEDGYFVVILVEEKIVTFHPYQCDDIFDSVYGKLVTHTHTRNSLPSPPSAERDRSDEADSSLVFDIEILKKKMRKPFSSRSPEWIMLKLCEEVILQIESAVDHIIAEGKTLSDLVYMLGVQDSNELMVRVGRASTNLCDTRMKLRPKKETLKRLLKKSYVSEQRDILHPGVRNYFGNALDRIAHMIERLDVGMDQLRGIEKNYLGQMSIQMALLSYMLNNSMQQLNSVMAVMLPLTVIMGIFSMNVNVPGETDQGSDLSWFFGILGVMGAMMIAMGFYLRTLKVKFD